MHTYKKYLFMGLAALGLAGLFGFGQYLDWLWFKSMAADRIFWLPRLTGPFAKGLVALVVFVFFSINLKLALKSFQPIRQVDGPWPAVSREMVVLPGWIAAAGLAVSLAVGIRLDWTIIQPYLHQVPVGQVDPIFGKDLGFYLFTYPLYQRLDHLLQSVTLIGLAGSGLIYFLSRSFTRVGRFWEIPFPAKMHLTILTMLFLGAKIWSYRLGRFELLYQESLRLTGINYAAHHANLLVLQIMTGLVAVIIAILCLSLFRKSNNSLILGGGIGLWLAVSLLGGAYPALIQSLVVTPNEYELEEPYLKHHIQMTRQAFALDTIAIQPFEPQDQSGLALNGSNPSLEDLRLWDYRPLKASYNQLQSIRSYYYFNDIDIDRYPSTSGQRQVMISARELLPSALSARAKSWMNLHLVYTHGYGLAANPVNQFSKQGQPIFIAKDLPPKTANDFPALQIERPELYFGELTDHYIITRTKIEEFNYPRGDQNIATVYQGDNGIPLRSLLTRLMFALKYQEANFLLSSYLTADSQILIHRNIQDRLGQLAPFLKFDADPYLVVADGQLFWIVDGYTASSYYPYTRRHPEGMNYIRNSVKAVINAYTGAVDFYVVDEDDPLIQMWQRVFPRFFQARDAASPAIVAHFRYPDYLMQIQRDILAQYHMTDLKTFYSQEDYWDIPILGNDQPFEPYYVTLRLPNEPSGEFVMMQPFSPRNKQNLIAWLVARCDGPNYGRLILYTLPKDQNIYGPAQIDSRINQNETISQLITLWNQNQSQVTWGSLLIIPIENSLLYVKPLFIESERGQQAELKKIVMVYENQVLIGDTVAETLNQLISSNAALPTAESRPSPTENKKSSANRADTLKRIEALTREIQRLLKELGTD